MHADGQRLRLRAALGGAPGSGWLSGRRLELALFAILLVVLNAPLVVGRVPAGLIFHPEAVLAGEWWRLLAHPFVHATWYHLLLDGAAFLALYRSLLEPSCVRRLACVGAAGAGSLLAAWFGGGAVATSGLCGLSGIAHGLMAVSALEAVGQGAPGSADRRLGWLSFAVVVGKSAFEAVSGQMLFTFLHFGLMGDPVAASHAGGVIGSLVVWGAFQAGARALRLRGCWRLKVWIARAAVGASTTRAGRRPRLSGGLAAGGAALGRGGRSRTPGGAELERV